jgi:hypothetical protein
MQWGIESKKAQSVSGENALNMHPFTDGLFVILPVLPSRIDSYSQWSLKCV